MDRKVRNLEMRLPDIENAELLETVGVSGVSKELSLSLLVLGDKASNLGDHGGGVEGDDVPIGLGVKRVVFMANGCTVGGVLRGAIMSNGCTASDAISFSCWIGKSILSAPSRVVGVGGEEWTEENEPGTS
jgi:hypothetical protein